MSSMIIRKNNKEYPVPILKDVDYSTLLLEVDNVLKAGTGDDDTNLNNVSLNGVEVSLDYLDEHPVLSTIDSVHLILLFKGLVLDTIGDLEEDMLS